MGEREGISGAVVERNFPTGDTIERKPFEIRRMDALPRGAWLAEVAGVGVRALCGDGVEIFEDGLVEGCWDGAFEERRFERAANLFGSGFARRNDTVVLAAPSHTLEALYLHETKGRIVASNSLAFLLEHERLEPPAEAMVCRRLATLVLGLNAYERVVFEHADGRILRIAGAVIELCDGRLNVRSRTFERRFADFTAYEGYLVETLRAVFENGASPLRRRPLRPMTTVSSGYDSTACAALAATLGCREALTLQTGRSGRSDTGLAVGRALGLEVHAFERVREGAPITRHDEAEFLATGMGGEDLPFAAFEPVLEGRIVLTGFYGGRLWAKGAPNAVLARDDLSGCSLTEFRLRTGFVNLPVLFIGCVRADEIRRIALSDEMAAWRLGTDYDRPVLRRIVEEAGVPRHLFGQRKEAVSSLVFQQSRFLSRPTRQILQAFGRDRGTARMRRMQRTWWVRYQAGRALGKLARIAGIKPARRWIEAIVLGEDWRVFEHSSPSTELAFRWGLERIRPRYQHRRGFVPKGERRERET